MIQHRTSIIHSEITGSLWKVVTYLPYERKLRAYWEHFEFRFVACVGVSCEGAEGSSLRKVNLGYKARKHTCGNQFLLSIVFQSYPGQVGTFSVFCGKDSNLVPCHDQHKCVDFSFLSFQPLQPSKNKLSQPSGHRNNTTNKQLCLDLHKQHFWGKLCPRGLDTLFLCNLLTNNY